MATPVGPSVTPAPGTKSQVGDTMSALFQKLSLLIEKADELLRDKIEGMEVTASGGADGSPVTEDINPVDLLNVQLNMNMYKTTTDLATNTMSTAQNILSAVNQNLNIR